MLRRPVAYGLWLTDCGPYGRQAAPIPLRHFHLQARRVRRVWRNMPPAAVWRYSRIPGEPVVRNRG